MGLVVGGAVVRHGRVLAARRTWPADAAGRWELPGGKVEPGEQPAEALVRELEEELGVAAVVTGWLAGEQPVAGGRHSLRVGVVEATGEPTLVDHDAARWLGPEELGEVDWLEPDRPFLVELRERLLDGERLAGGHVGGAVRIGDTVRRPTGPWTPAVHAYLDHLRACGLDRVPRVHGLDARGREVLDLLPGRVVDVDHDQLTDGQLAALARWARRLHDAAGDFEHPGPWRFFGVAEPTVVAHNDLAPYNACFDGEELTGVFDWDLAGPSTPLMELGLLAWTAVPLFREVPADRAAARLRVVAAAYGGVTAADVLAAVEPRVRVAIAGIRAAAAAGDAGMQALAATGEPGRTEDALATHLRRRHVLERLVQDRPVLDRPVHDRPVHDRPVQARGIFFDEDDARAAARQLLSDGYDAEVAREPFAGEDDDEDHPWAVTTDAPEFVLDLLVDRFDGWLDVPDPGPAALPPRPPLDLPDAPRRRGRPPV